MSAPRIADIQTIVAKRCKLTRRILMEATRDADVCKARQDAMYLASKLTRHSKSRIGDFFGGRDHSTVIHAIRRAEQRIATDLVERAEIEELAAMLKGAGR